MQAYLVLANGRTFRGERFGADGDVIAEVVFTTGMTGYLETLTDKSYFGQAVIQTFPLIGNYGIIPEDFEGDMIGPKAYIVKNWCQAPSNFRSEGDLDSFFKARNIVALSGIDTRAVTKIIRDNGVMNGAIVSDPDNVDLDAIKSYRIQGAVSAVSVKEFARFDVDGGDKTVALMDFGIQNSIIHALQKRGCQVIVCPHDTTAAQIAALRADGILLSDGPGDPSDNPEIVANLKEIIGLGLPMFGFGLGHQFMALAHGFGMSRLKYGHRGTNQPVRDLRDGKVFVTSQNHGYTVDSVTVDPAVAREIFVNINDNTCEGIEYTGAPIFTTQFYPEACAGAEEPGGIWDKYVVQVISNR